MLRYVRHIGLFILLIGGLLCVCQPMRAAVHTGNCGANGDNVTWSYDDQTKVLTLSGKGAMMDFSNAMNVSWYSYKSNIQSIEISSEITKIGKFAFYGCSKVTSVTIPTAVTEIGNSAFAFNTELADVYVQWTTADEIPDIKAWSGFSGTIHVPCGTKLLYQSKGGWNDMIDQIAVPTYKVSVTIDDDSMGTIVITKE